MATNNRTRTHYWIELIVLGGLLVVAALTVAMQNRWRASFVDPDTGERVMPADVYSEVLALRGEMAELAVQLHAVGESLETKPADVLERLSLAIERLRLDIQRMQLTKPD